MRSKSFFVLMHICVWAVILFFPFLFDFRPDSPRYDSFGPPEFLRDRFFEFNSILRLLSLMPLFYINAYYLVPHYFNRKRWVFYIVLLTLLFVGLKSLDGLINWFVTGRIGFPGPPRIFISFNGFFLMASIAYGLIMQNLKQENKVQEKEAENMKTELAFLRSQINPHFLFNTLNNLVSLARKKSDRLETSLLQLSGLMHYMLYETDDSKINIFNEIEYLENYIELQKLRFGEELSVSFIKNLPEDCSMEIEPMILISFLENAFKHGIAGLENPEIQIEISVRHNLFYFEVRNKYITKYGPDQRIEKIGLNNVQRRLNLLYPKGSNNPLRLLIEQQEGWYVVKLTIML